MAAVGPRITRIVAIGSTVSTMKDISSQAESTTSIVRLSFQSAHKDKIEASEQWFAATDRLKQEPDLGFVTIGRPTADEADIVLFISWDYAAKPSASFLSGDVDHIFSPLGGFLTKKPQLICDICSVTGRQSKSSFTTSDTSWPEVMSEIMTVRGPANATESTMSKIFKEIRAYMDAMDTGMDFYNIHVSEQTLFSSRLYRLSGEYARDGIDSEEHIDYANFILFLDWFSPSRRAEVQDPDIPERAIPAFLQEFYGNDWWQKQVIQPLEEVGATISSFLYRGKIAHDRKGVLVMSKFKIWLQYGFMDDDSLAQFERQLAEKNKQQQ
ncbi:hypothetical protein MKX08_006150 [Trichoderma sp. CBMAI-0020]|nr:hypothetical protein MKX08_006150 [Trichoderma sp. CBMAI-0020]